MILLARVRAWLRSVTRRSRFERDMAAELRFHIESYTEDLVRVGVARDDARRRARLEFGAIEWKKDDCRATLGVRFVDDLLTDVRYALRVLRRSPGFAFVTVATLALGIGANTTMFTLIDALLLRQLPVHDPRALYQVTRQEGATATRFDGMFTNVLWENLAARQDVFSSIGAWGNTRFNLASGGAVQEAVGLWVTGNYFGTLEVTPILGRLIQPADDVRGCRGVAVLSYAFWQRRYGGAADAVGRTIALDGRPYAIVGVSAQGFHGLDVGDTFDVALPACATAQMDRGRSRLDARSWWWLTVIGRRRADVSESQMQARLMAISSSVAAASVPQQWEPRYRDPFLHARLVPVPAAAGISYSFRQQFRNPLLLLMAVVGVVLLIACANIAGLMLARSAAGQREINVRLALGAGRWRLVRQWLTQALLLSAAGGAAGTLAAGWGTALLVRSISTQQSQIFLDVSPDWRIAAFTAAVVLMTTVTFGVVPAFRSTRVPLTAAVRGAAGIAQGRSDHRARTLIVAAQIALSLALLVTAGLCLRTFGALVHRQLGFDRHNVLLIGADLHATSIDVSQHLATFEAMQARLTALPGVVAAGRSHIVPLGGGGWNDDVRTDNPSAVQGPAEARMNFISPGYFAAMRMTLREGRDIASADTATSARVVVVNQTFARKFYGSIDPIAHMIAIPKTSGELGPQIQIVGVVEDAAYQSLRAPMPATAFFPITQIPEPEMSDTFALRTSVPPETLVAAAEATVASVNPRIPLTFKTLARQVDDAMVTERVVAELSAFFGGMALLLAIIGLYGTISYRVTLRRAEFGIRKALGAAPQSITRLVVSEVARILVVGTVAGLVLSSLATSTLTTLLFGVEPRDWTTMAGAAILLGLVALAAGYLPARRAARADPMAALRCD
jgi:putative ABC transport system permease protein